MSASSSNERSARREIERRIRGHGHLRRGFERRSRAEAGSERELPFLEPSHGDDVVPAADLQGHSARSEVDDARRIRIRLIGPPDAVDWPGRPEPGHRRVEPEHEAPEVLRAHPFQGGRGDGGGIVGMGGDIHGPFESRDVRQVRVARARWEGFEERGEGRAVLEEARSGGRMASDVAICREAEEPSIHQPAHDRKGRLEGAGQAREDVVPVDLDSRSGRRRRPRRSRPSTPWASFRRSAEANAAWSSGSVCIIDGTPKPGVGSSGLRQEDLEGRDLGVPLDQGREPRRTVGSRGRRAPTRPEQPANRGRRSRASGRPSSLVECPARCSSPTASAGSASRYATGSSPRFLAVTYTLLTSHRRPHPVRRTSSARNWASGIVDVANRR